MDILFKIIENFRIKELCYLGLVIITCHIISFVTHSQIPCMIMNILLIVYYCLFLYDRLPRIFRLKKEENLSKLEKTSIVLCIVYSSVFLLRYIPFLDYTFKPLGRVIFLSLLIFTLISYMYTMIRLVSSGETIWSMKRYIEVYNRTGIVLLSNILIAFSYLTYSSDSEYLNGNLVRKMVCNGNDSYITLFDKTRSVYETKVHIEDTHPAMDYIIYYDSYPDKINHIDTLNVEY